MMMLIREAMRPVVIGIAVGVAGAFAMTRVLSAMLFEVSATDVTTYAIAWACSVPRWRVDRPARRALASIRSLLFAASKASTDFTDLPRMRRTREAGLRPASARCRRRIKR